MGLQPGMGIGTGKSGSLGSAPPCPGAWEQDSGARGFLLVVSEVTLPCLGLPPPALLVPQPIGRPSSSG